MNFKSETTVEALKLITDGPSPQARLQEWQATLPESVSTAVVETDEALQMRIESLVPWADRGRQREESERHVASMAAWLRDRKSKELEPILLTRVADRLLVVDGHHRLTAYRDAKRLTIPARVLTVGLEEAVRVARLVNTTGTKLPLHVEQAREAAWQHLAYLTMKGTRPLPKDASLRKMGSQFGVSKSTIENMVKRLGYGVKVEEFAAAACDPATGWPRWKYLRTPSDRMLPPTDDVRVRKFIAAQVKLLSKFSPEIVRAGLEVLRDERRDAQAEAILEALEDDEGL